MLTPFALCTDNPMHKPHSPFIRAPQSFAGGILLVALAALALWLTRNLDQGTLNAMGPAMLPRWLAIAVGLSGMALLAFVFAKESDALERWSLRGPVFVIGAILAFAVTIRPVSFGGLATPGLGLLVAGPLAIILGGYATPEARLRDLVILTLSLPPLHGGCARESHDWCSRDPRPPTSARPAVAPAAG